MRAILLILFICCVGASLAQTRIDSLITEAEKLPVASSQRIDKLNEIGFEYWIVDPSKSMDYGGEALEQAKQIDYVLGIATANRILGVAHWTRGNFLEAIKYLNEAETGFSQLGDEEGVANSLLNSGMVYADLKEYARALELYERSIDKFTALNREDRIATAYTKIASLYLEQDKFFDAKTYLDNALSIHSKNNFTYGMAEVHNRLGIYFIKQEDPEQAYYHIRRSIILGRDVNDKDGAVSNLIQYGKLLRMDGEYEAAGFHLKLGAKRAKANSLKRYELEAYKELKELKQSEGQLDSALYFSDTYSTLKDSIFNSEKTAQIATIAFKNELESKDKEVALLQEQERADRAIKWGLFFGVIGVTILGLVTINGYKQRARRNKELSLQKQELLTSKEELAQTALENSRLKRQELEQQLDFKNKELTSYTLNFVQKNEFLQQLQEKMRLIKSNSGTTQARLIEEVNRDIRQHVTIDRDWEDFKRSFEAVHTDFYQRLKEKHPGLSANDLKLCSLTRLNLNTKETASILGISPESAKTARYRLRKKLNLAPEDELLDYFLTIERA